MENPFKKKEPRPLPPEAIKAPGEITSDMIQRLKEETGFQGSDEEAVEEIKRRMRIGKREAE